MAGSGIVLLPSYTEDLEYPAYQDRLLMKSIVQAGVVGEEDYKVSAGTGQQVNVKKGKAFVTQSKATQESSNIFYNGLYNCLNPIEQNPFNRVEVNSVDPQLAQIILRVYDVDELGSTGSSYARLEWLNGIPSEGANLSNRSGAAELPTSCIRLADVLVPASAASSASYTIRDRRPWALGAFYSAIWATPGGLHTESNAFSTIGEPLQCRIESNGLPMEVSAQVTLTSTEANNAVLTVFVNSVGGGPEIVQTITAGGYANMNYNWVYPGFAGSLLLQLVWRSLSSKKMTIELTPTFEVRELITGSYNGKS